MNSADPITALVGRFPRLFRGQPPLVHSFVPLEWLAVVDELFEDLDRMLDDTDAAQFKVRQIKEKLGGLRVYWWLGPRRGEPGDDGRDARDWYSPVLFDRIEARIRNAEDRCESVCTDCGAPEGAHVRSHNWPYKLCDSCWSVRDPTD